MDAAVAATIVAAAEAEANGTGDTPKTLNSSSTIDTRSTRTQSAKLAANHNNTNGVSNEPPSVAHHTTSHKNQNFLDNVPEEEKRIRMRYLPNVDGIRGLHKSEIKSDLKAARLRLDSSNGGSTIIEEEPNPTAQELLANPTVAASITCYNPPTLPESTATKKADRIKRWMDGKSIRAIENDLKGFRKTVQRTLDELASLNVERSQLQCVHETIKKNLLAQLELFEHEEDEAKDVLDRLMWECDIKSINEVLETGGSNASFSESTIETTLRQCPSWIVPGDTVRTPYGKGKILNVTRAMSSTAIKVTIQLDFGTAYLFGKEIEVIGKENMMERWETLLNHSDIVACSIGSIDLSHKFTDGYDDVSSDLLYPSAPLPYSVVTSSSASSVSSSDENEHLNMDVECEDTQEENKVSTEATDKTDTTMRPRLLPFGDSRLPTKYSRESTMFVDLEELQSTIRSYLFDCKSNDSARINVPTQIKDWEITREEIYKSKAKVLQKRNQLEIQRQIAQLYSKGLSVCNDRLEKHMSYCSEMDDDLNSLKERLAAELIELNISEEKVEDMIITRLREREQHRPKKKRKGADKEMKEQFVPRLSRRKAEEAKNASTTLKVDEESHSQEDADESSVTSSRRGKRGRGSGGDDESVSSEKPKRGYTRRNVS